MDAMSYECLLRGIYKVGRFEEKGIDAGFYKDMEHAQRGYELDLENSKRGKPRISSKSIDDLLYDYQVESRKVWRYVTDAINKGIKDHSYLLSDIDIKSLNDSIKEPRNVFKEDIDNAITIAESIFMKYKIYP